jgi:nucleotide-binding universal stress UspA family protein
MRDVAVAILSQPDQAESLLDAATLYLAITGGGRLRALVIRMPPEATILPSEEVLTVERAAAIRAEQAEWAGSLGAVIDAWRPRAEHQGVEAELVNVEGDAAAVVVEQGRRADAIVVARPAAHESQRVHDGMHAALFETGCPVLVVPPQFDGRLGRVVAIAWKDDERAAKAVRAALPILAKAEEVHVLGAGPGAALPAVLADHDIDATLHVVPEGDGTVGDRILHAAHQLGADLLVMGAFSHAAWRERLFGGVTRTMLARADLPLLMRH